VLPPQGRILTSGLPGHRICRETRSPPIADFRADTKWRDYRAHCDKLFFAIPETMPIEIMPDDAGLILADAYGAEILREASPSTRRAMLIRFADAAAHRLHCLSDPEVVAQSR
jgi:hypothetical protein